MIKRAPTVGQMVAMAAFALSCFGLLLFLWLAFGGPIPLKPKGYRFEDSFGEAQQLAKEADVRISGVSVGKVKDIEPDKRPAAPSRRSSSRRSTRRCPKDAKAILRQKTLLGETYVELTPGTASAGMLPEGGQPATARVSPTVELDEMFRAFDPEPRRNFQIWMQQLAVAVVGRGADINDAFGNLAPFAEDAGTS